MRCCCKVVFVLVFLGSHLDSVIEEDPVHYGPHSRSSLVCLFANLCLIYVVREQGKQQTKEYLLNKQDNDLKKDQFENGGRHEAEEDMVQKYRQDESMWKSNGMAM